MIATDYKLIPLAVLHKHEAAVVRGLDSLPISYAKNLLEEPEIRYAFYYYALLTHWPQWLNGDFTAEELLYNRLYWYRRLSVLYKVDHDFDAGFEHQEAALIEVANQELGADVVLGVNRLVRREIVTNEREIAVSYSNFSIGKVKTELGVEIDEDGDFFADVSRLAVSAMLLEILKSSMPLALKINTEKARSEMIVAPILMEIYQQLDQKISLFSGVEWEVDGDLGLRGRCDFLMGLSSEQMRIEAPVAAIVEVKNNNTAAGIAQCLAEMVAARIFNQRNQNDIPIIYGIVTTGSTWKFLRLVDSVAYVDQTEYYINDVERIVGIIVSMFTSSGITRKA